MNYKEDIKMMEFIRSLSIYRSGFVESISVASNAVEWHIVEVKANMWVDGLDMYSICAQAGLADILLMIKAVDSNLKLYFCWNQAYLKCHTVS